MAQCVLFCFSSKMKASNQVECLIGNKNWKDWYELGLRQEKGSALGAALQSFEYALELNPTNPKVAEARKRVAKHFIHIPKYKAIVRPDT